MSRRQPAVGSRDDGQGQEHHDGFQDQRASHHAAKALPRIRRRGLIGLIAHSGSRPNSVRAAPAVTTDPVMTMPLPEKPSPSCPASSTSAVAVSMASGRVDGHDDPLRPESLLGPHREALDVERARRTVVGHDDLIEDRFQRGQDAIDVLLGHHRDDADEEMEVELLGQRLRQCRCTCRVMGGIDENCWGAAHPFQSPWADGGGKTGPDGIDVELPFRPCAEERLDGGQRDDGVAGLMFAVQRQEDLGVHPAEALQFEQLAADRHLAAQHRELGVLASDRGVGCARPRPAPPPSPRAPACRSPRRCRPAPDRPSGRR